MSDDRLRQAIIGYLKEHPAVRAVLGGRIYPLVLPQNLDTYPAAVVIRVDATRSHTKLGPSGLAEARIQCSVWSPRLLDSVSGADAIREALDGYRGEMNGVSIGNIRSDVEQDFYEPDVGLYQVVTDYMVSYE